MTVYDTSFGIDLSYKIVRNKTSHNSKAPSPGKKKSILNFQAYKLMSLMYDRPKQEKGLICVNVEKGYKFVIAEIIGSL